MTFAEKCRKLRTEKNLTQEEAAAAADISRRTYIYYESGQKLPRTKATVNKLAELFGVDSNYLVVENDDIIDDRNNLPAAERAEAFLKDLTGMLGDENVPPEIKKNLCLSLSEICTDWNKKESSL